MRFYFFRHGLSLANEADLVTGTPEDVLSPAGIEQAQYLANWVAELGIEADYFTYSHWQRAQQTASCLWPDACWQEDTRLGETCAGSVAELPLATFLLQSADFYQDAQRAYPDGESHLDLQRRVLSWFFEILQRPYRNVVVVAHAGPIACILQEILGIPMSQFPAILPLNASLTLIDAEYKAGIVFGKLLGLSLGASNNLHAFLLKDR